MNKPRGSTDKKISQLPNWLWSNSNSLPCVYRRIWEAVREERSGNLGNDRGESLVDTKKIFPLLLTSQLPTEVLGYIWGLANQKYAGKLTEQELYAVLALVAVAQTSYPFTNLEVLHLLPGPPEPRLNLTLVEGEASSRFSGEEKNAAKSSRKSRSDVDTDFRTTSAQRADRKAWTNDRVASSDSGDDFSEFQSAPVSQAAPILSARDAKQVSAIGSRLANHNLGVKKSVEKQKKVSAGNASAIRERHLLPGLPVAGKDPLPVVERSADLFAKCALKNQAKTVILKDTAIRNDCPKNQSRETSALPGIDDIRIPPPAKQTSGKSALAIGSADPENVSKDLMNLQQVEDKYSALRILVEEPIFPERKSVMEPVSATGQCDDFGEFVSARQPESSPISSTIVENSSSNLNEDSTDFFTDFEYFGSSTRPEKLAEASSTAEIAKETFATFEIGISPDRRSLEDKDDATIESEKMSPKEDAISVNSIELGNGTIGIATRSNSVPSLDLKSFLSPSVDEEQQVENMHQLIYWEWKRYMESCVLLLQTAANVFGSITCEIVLQEVMASAQGYNFLCNLAEVAAVCRRVNFSHKEMDINIMGFDDLLMEIDRIWAEMEPYYTNIPIVTELPVWPLHRSESSACCSLCLTVVTSGRIVHNDNNYHATCANLWLNCVNHNLPTLRYPQSSTVSHSLPIASIGNNRI